MSEHCYFMSAGELRAIVGDDTDHGAGRDEHSGVWFLTSTKDRHTAVSQGNGILLFGHHRGTRPSVRRVNDVSVELFKEACEANNHVETRGTYRLVAPHDIELRDDGHRPVRAPVAGPHVIQLVLLCKFTNRQGNPFYREGAVDVLLQSGSRAGRNGLSNRSGRG